mmetsp:Transcript_14990/g.43273  ORF Transcript_14990/g.43273 Transcript_14990/m.43273 type:complete len:153 (+) Transcript_14990:107-565(+)
MAIVRMISMLACCFRLANAAPLIFLEAAAGTNNDGAARELAKGGNPCTGGDVGRLRRIAPECIDGCQSSCVAVLDVINSFHQAGRVAAEDAMCSRRRYFECFLHEGRRGACRPFVEEAKAYGIVLPSSREALGEKCGVAGSRPDSASDTILP